MVSKRELFYGSLARTWQLLTPGQLVAILADQDEGGPSLPDAMLELGCATDDKVQQMRALEKQVFRNPLDDFSLDMLPEAGLIEVVRCDACGEKSEIEDYDPRESYPCKNCGEQMPPRLTGPPDVDDSSRVLPMFSDSSVLDATGDVVIATEDDDLDDTGLSQVVQKEVAEISLDSTGTHYAEKGGGAQTPPKKKTRRRRRQNRAPVIVGLELDADDPRAAAAAAAAAGPAGGGSWGPPNKRVEAKTPAPAATPAPAPAPAPAPKVEAAPPAQAEVAAKVVCACDAELQADWKFCPSCGAAACACDSCGRALEAEWKRCPYCLG